MIDYFNSISQQIRHWINLLSESKDHSIYFTDNELDKLEQYGYPIYGFAESIRDPASTTEELRSIKKFLDMLLLDGGLWGETFNAHDIGTSRLKSKIISLIELIDS